MKYQIQIHVNGKWQGVGREYSRLQDAEQALPVLYPVQARLLSFGVVPTIRIAEVVE